MFNEHDHQNNNSILAAGDEVIIASSNVQPLNSYRVVKPVGHNLKASLQPLILDSSGNSFEDVKVTPQHQRGNRRNQQQDGSISPDESHNHNNVTAINKQRYDPKQSKKIVGGNIGMLELT